MAFEYSSIIDKYENLTGKSSHGNTWFSTWEVENAGCISIVLDLHHSEYYDHTLIRDWCEDRFGNDWIYSFSTYYFKNAGDAALFSLKWA